MIFGCDSELYVVLSTISGIFFFLPGLDLLWQANENFRSFIISSQTVSFKRERETWIESKANQI